MADDDAVQLSLETLRLSQEGRVLTAEVHAPPHNFMTGRMQQDLLALVAAVERDESVGAVVVTGGLPGRYITHFDIAELLEAAEGAPESLPGPLAQAAITSATLAAKVDLVASGLERTSVGGVLAVTRFHDLVQQVMRSPAVWIAAVNGPCGGGGLELSVHFDVRLAADDAASFLLPELLIGLTTTVGGQRLAQLLGPGRALEMMLEGRAYGAAEAVAMGLVSRSVPDADLASVAAELATRYASRNRRVVAAQKRILNESGPLGVGESLRREGAAQLAGIGSPVSLEALRTWLAEQDDDGDSVFLTRPGPWIAGTAVDLNPG